MHGTINALGALTLIMVKGGTDLTIGLTGFAGFIALFLVVAAFVVYDYFVSCEKIMLGTVGTSLPVVPESINT